MQRDVPSGILLIAGALASMLVLSLHPTGHEILSAGDFQEQANLNVMIHGLALAATPILFLGLLGVSRRLGHSDLTTAALVAYGFGAVAIMAAAVASGFVATAVLEQISVGAGDADDVYHVLGWYTGLVNQGFAKVYVVAASVAILLWSVAVFKSEAMGSAVGVAGLVAGAGVLLAFLSGHLSLDVHGFGILTFAQGGWFIWLGILMCGRRKTA